MTRWRKRIGVGRLATLLADTPAIALDKGATRPAAMARVPIDTTVQTKANAYPTDGHLMLRAIEAHRRQGRALRHPSPLPPCAVCTSSQQSRCHYATPGHGATPFFLVSFSSNLLSLRKCRRTRVKEPKL